MSIEVKNAKQMPRVYYGLHMAEGVAEYPEQTDEIGKPLRILVLQNAIQTMNPTFEGCPVFVDHAAVDMNKLDEADGYVIKSFFNQTDGKHWAQFLIKTDAGHEAIRNGFKLSNAYIPSSERGAGQWHAVPYAREVTNGKFTHLALVKNPRYEESIVLTPEEFTAYNSRKAAELKALQNSKEKRSMKWNIFGSRKTIENADEIAEMTVVLPKSKREVKISELLNAADSEAAAGDSPASAVAYANGDHLVKVGEGHMSVNELSSKYCDMKNAMDEMEKKKKEEEEKAEKEKANSKSDAEKAAEAKAAADAAKTAEQLQNEKVEAAKVEAAAKLAADELANAGPGTVKKDEQVLDTPQDQLARGKQRY